MIFEKPIYTVKECGGILVMHYQAVLDLIHNGQLKAMRIPASPASRRKKVNKSGQFGRYRIAAEDLAAFIEKCRNESSTEVHKSWPQVGPKRPKRARQSADKTWPQAGAKNDDNSLKPNWYKEFA